MEKKYLLVKWDKDRLVCEYKGAQVSILYARDSKKSTKEKMEKDLNIVIFDKKVHG